MPLEHTVRLQGATVTCRGHDDGRATGTTAGAWRSPPGQPVPWGTAAERRRTAALLIPRSGRYGPSRQRAQKTWRGKLEGLAASHLQAATDCAMLCMQPIPRER